MEQRRGRAALAHMPQLDGLRALAALAVVFHHNLWRDPESWLGATRQAAALGESGVRLFFVLSGFLITGILLRARDEADGASAGSILRAFYARRFLRIFPLYYMVVIAVALIGQPLMRETLGWNLAYLTNVKLALLGQFPGPPVSHLWSLAVEEQFYLTWPFLVLLAPRRSLLPLVLMALLVGPASRLAIQLGTGNEVAAAVLTPSCLDTLGAGALLALLRMGRGEAFTGRVARAALWPGLLLLGTVTAVDWADGPRWVPVVLRDTAYAAVFFWVVHRSAQGFRGRAGRFLRWGPLVYLGTISYGIYVYHHILPALLGPRTGFPTEFGLFRTFCVLAITIPLSALSFHFFEAPINRLKSRFPYLPRRRALSPQPAPPVEVTSPTV